MIVVDTNILVNYLWRQDDAVRVRRRDAQWAAPLIAVSELRNALLGFVRQGLAPADEAKRMNAEALSLLGGRIHPVDGGEVLDAAWNAGSPPTTPNSSSAPERSARRSSRSTEPSCVARLTPPSRLRRSPSPNGTADAPPPALVELAAPREGNVRRKEPRLWDAA